MTCFTLSCTGPFPIAQYYRLRHGQRPIEAAKEGEAEVRAVLDVPVVCIAGHADFGQRAHAPFSASQSSAAVNEADKLWSREDDLDLDGSCHPRILLRTHYRTDMLATRA